jgi:hypothetical protein
MSEPPEAIGPTGEYSAGKYTENDKGDIAVGVRADPSTRKVVLKFGTPVKWVAITPEDVTGFAWSLIIKARAIFLEAIQLGASGSPSPMDITLAADARNRRIVIDFSLPIEELALDPEEAFAFAEALLEKQRQIIGIPLE